jgi:hypothetical protein
LMPFVVRFINSKGTSRDPLTRPSRVTLVQWITRQRQAGVSARIAEY